MTLVFVVAVFVVVFLNKETTPSITVIALLLSMAFGVPLVWHYFRKNSAWIIAALSYLLLIGLLVWIMMFQPVLYLSVFQGHVTIEMDDIYYKNNAPIPVLIQVTGPNTGLSVSLSKEESGYNLTLIDSIRYLEPEHNKTMVVSGENSFLCGNALDYGKYSVFIKATNLSPGYYELVCVRPKYSKVYGVKGFYLLNKS